MILSNFFNGEARSKYDGYDKTDNLDVHAQTGTAQCQFALASESSLPNEACVSAKNTNGDVYFFSTESGKTWKRTVAGSYSLVNTNVNGAHRGARYFNGKIFYWTSDDLGHFDLSSTWTDSFGVFSNANAQGGDVVNDVLFIGDGNYVASVTSGDVFTANSLDLPKEFSVSDVISWNARLLIGTTTGQNVSHCKVFLWDTYSPSWTTDDDVFEVGINTFVRVDNIVLAQCGTSGALYAWNGSRMEIFKRIRNVTTLVSNISHALKDVHNGVSLLGIGSDIYSIHRQDKDLPFSIVHEYTVTTGSVFSITSIGGSLLVSNGSNIDKEGTNYATAKLTTPVIQGDGIDNLFEFSYESMPSGCSMTLRSNVNGSGWVSESDFVNDTTYMKYKLRNGLTYNGNINFVQLEITLVPNGSSTPILQKIIV